MSAFGGKANIALTCRLVSNMAQRHFLLALTMATEARPRRGTDLIREVLHPEYQFGCFGWLLARMRGLHHVSDLLFKLQGTKG
jgi:hypothetical protein